MRSVVSGRLCLFARGSVGGELRHSPNLTTFAEYRFIDASDNKLLDVGWNYQLTQLYRVAISPQWDFKNDEFRSVRLRVVRAFPEFDLTVAVRYDSIKDETSVGASLGLVEF